MRWVRVRGRALAAALVAVAGLIVILGGLFGRENPGHRTTPPISPSATTTTPRPSATSPPTTPVPASHPVGFSAPQLPYLDPAALDRQLTGMRALGASWIRIDLSWPVVQPDSPTRYDWSRYDRVVQAASRLGFTVDGVLDYTAPWARLADCADHFQCQPRNPQLYIDFASAAAQHFRDSAVTTMEIWNEPNVRQFWLPAPNAAFYTAMLTGGYRAIKTVDPDYRVLTGGLSPSATVSQVSYSPLDFLDRMYDYGAHGSFDALGYHPYSYPNLPSAFNLASAFSQIDQTPRSLRSILSAHGDPRMPIWLTEVGAPTGGPGPSSTCDDRAFSATHTVVSECLQAKLLSDALCQASRMDDLGPTFLYSYQDQGTDPASAENFFGLLRADGTKKPSYAAVAEAIAHPCR